MSLGRKLLYGAAGIVATVALLICALTAWDGIVYVRIRESQGNADHHIYVAAPAFLVPAVLQFTPGRYFQRAGRQMRPWLPALRAAIDSLGEIPDSTFVEVTTGDSHILVRKQGRNLVADVKAAEDNVHVSVPLRVCRQAFEEIAAKSGD